MSHPTQRMRFEPHSRLAEPCKSFEESDDFISNFVHILLRCHHW